MRIEFACGVACCRHFAETGSFRKALPEAPLPLPRWIKFAWSLDGRAREGGEKEAAKAQALGIWHAPYLKATPICRAAYLQNGYRTHLDIDMHMVGIGMDIPNPLTSSSQGKTGLSCS